jgi:hypothetical protein
MTSDIAARLERLRCQTAQLGEVAAGLAAATPRQAEGTDPTGWVRVAVAGDGLPHAIQVRPGWRQRLEADRLGAAVAQANAAAIGEGMRAWTDELDRFVVAEAFTAGR